MRLTNTYVAAEGERQGTAQLAYLFALFWTFVLLRFALSANLLDLKVEEIMTHQPKTVRPDQLASEALEILNTSKKTQLIVVEKDEPIGVIHVHDLLRAGVA